MFATRTRLFETAMERLIIATIDVHTFSPAEISTAGQGYRAPLLWLRLINHDGRVNAWEGRITLPIFITGLDMHVRPLRRTKKSNQ
jgi:hypothetical protein